MLEEIDGVTDGYSLLQYLNERFGLIAIQRYNQGNIVKFRIQAFQEYFFAIEVVPMLINKSVADMHINEDISNFIFDLITTSPEYLKLYATKTKNQMVYIPEGPTIIGQDDNVFIKNFNYDYYIDIYPVTNTQYHEFTKATNYKVPNHWEGGVITPEDENKPVVYVSWNDCIQYAKWAGKTLPSELEWEKAAGGIDGRYYPWGINFKSDLCNTVESELLTTTPVDKYSPEGNSLFGVADVCGNVFEWTSSDFGTKGKTKVLKGGSFNYDKTLARLSNKIGYHPGLTHNHIGFRLCEKEVDIDHIDQYDKENDNIPALEENSAWRVVVQWRIPSECSCLHY